MQPRAALSTWQHRRMQVMQAGDRPMIIRWISDAPSKIVKLSGPTSRDQDLCS